MLDLFRSQRKSVKWLLSALLGLVALSMVITFVPNVFSSPDQNLNDPVLVEVGDETVTINDVYQAMRDYARAGTPPDAMAFMAEQTIENLVEERVLMQEADRLGLKPSDEELAAWIRDQMPFLFTGGSFNSAQYQTLIQQRFQITVAAFEAQLRKDLAIQTRLRRLVTDNIVVTDQELRDLYRRRNQEAKIEYAVVDTADFRSGVQATDEAAAAYFDANKPRYTIPEKRSIKLLTLDPADAPVPEISDAEIRNFYAQNRYRFETQDRVRASHILLMTINPDTGEEFSEAEIQKVEERAKEALTKVKAGEDFAEVAKEYSEDPGSKENGGDLGWVMRGQMVPKFEDAAFAMEPGQISDLVRTEFGYHIVQVHEKDRPQVKPLEEAREEIIADVTAERRQRAATERIDRAIAAARASAENLDQAARAVGASVQTFTDFTQQAPPAVIAGNQNLASQIFRAAAGDVVTAEAEDGRAYVAAVTAVTPSREARLEEVRDRVVEDFVSAEARTAAQARAAELAAKAKELGDLKKAAAAFNLKTQTSDFFNRQGSVAGFTNARAIGEAAFTAEIGSVHGPVSAGDRIGVFAPLERRDADMTGFLEARDELRGETLQSKRDEAFGIFRSVARDAYRQRGEIKRYENRIEQLLQQMRRG